MVLSTPFKLHSCLLYCISTQAHKLQSSESVHCMQAWMRSDGCGCMPVGCCVPAHQFCSSIACIMSLRDLLAVEYGTIRSLSLDVAVNSVAGVQDRTRTNLTHVMDAPTATANVDMLHSKQNDKTIPDCQCSFWQQYLFRKLRCYLRNPQLFSLHQLLLLRFWIWSSVDCPSICRGRKRVEIRGIQTQQQ